MATNVFGALLTRSGATCTAAQTPLAHVLNMDNNSADKGCLKCLRAHLTQELKGKPGVVAVSIPTNHCRKCHRKETSCFNSLAVGAGKAASWALPCLRCLDPFVHKTTVYLSGTALDSLIRAESTVLSTNDAKCSGQMNFLMDVPLAEYKKLCKSNWTRSIARVLHIRAAHALITDPQEFRFLSDDDSTVLEPGESLVIPTLRMGPDGRLHPVERRPHTAPHEHPPPDSRDPNHVVRPPPEDEIFRTAYFSEYNGADLEAFLLEVPADRMVAQDNAEHFDIFDNDDLQDEGVEEANTPDSVFAAQLESALAGGVPPVRLFGRPFYGVTATGPLGPLDPSTTILQPELEDLHPLDAADRVAEVMVRELIAAEEAMGTDVTGALCEEHPCFPDLADAGRVKVQGYYLLEGDPKRPVYSSAPNAENLVAALHNRHLKAAPATDAHNLDILKKVTDIYIETVLEGNKGIKNIRRKAKLFVHDLAARQPKKWSSARQDRAVMEAIMFAAPKLVMGKTGFTRTFTIKKNETLTKIKPRGIISTGDIGCAVHTVSPTIWGWLELECEQFLNRSVKHANKPKLARRLATILKSHEGWLHSNDDFGSFDSSLNQEVRDAIENRIASALHGWIHDIDGILGEASVKDRTCASKKGRGYGVRVTTTNMCRESGDKGTSDFNRATNRVVTAAVLWAALEEEGYPEEMIIKAVKSFFKGTSTMMDLVAEGDDGWRFYSKIFIALLGGIEVASGKIVALFKRFGFNLEPQTAEGRAENPGKECLNEMMGRSEFVSLVLVPYATKPGTLSLRLVPKPRKTMDSLATTFVLPNRPLDDGVPRAADHEMHAYTCSRDKALALMCNNIDCQLAYRMLRAVYNGCNGWLAEHRAAATRTVREKEVTMIDAENFMNNAGWNALELTDRFGDDVNTYFDQLEGVRFMLYEDSVGEKAADAAFARELLESAGPGSVLTKDNHLEVVKSFVDCLELASPNTFPQVWAVWRRAL